MNPNALRTRVADAIRAEVNPVRWARYVEAERVERESIIATTQAWQSTLEPDFKIERRRPRTGAGTRRGLAVHHPNP